LRYIHECHRRKIDLSDEIFVVNYDDYIGDSTRGEVEYALEKRIMVRWFTHDVVGDKVKQIIQQAITTTGEGVGKQE